MQLNPDFGLTVVVVPRRNYKACWRPLYQELRRLAAWIQEFRWPSPAKESFDRLYQVPDPVFCQNLQQPTGWHY